MTDPRQKAKELVEEFRLNVLDYEGCSINEHKAKQCAKIHVEGIIEANPYYFYPNRKVTRISDHSTKEYWQEVLNELNKM